MKAYAGDGSPEHAEFWQEVEDVAVVHLAEESPPTESEPCFFIIFLSFDAVKSRASSHETSWNLPRFLIRGVVSLSGLFTKL